MDNTNSRFASLFGAASESVSVTYQTLAVIDQYLLIPYSAKLGTQRERQSGKNLQNYVGNRLAIWRDAIGQCMDYYAYSPTFVK